MGTPSLIAGQAGQILARMNAFANWAANNCAGGIVSDGGTTQASGANGAFNFDCDVSAIYSATVAGTPGHSLAVQADADSDAGDDVAWGATSAVEVTYAVVLSTGSANDTPAIVAVHGDVATTAVGSDAPTDAEITTELGHSNWFRLATMLITRTADTTVTVGVDNTVRPVADYVTDLAETESAFRA